MDKKDRIVIVDTCIWIEFFRGGNIISENLRQLITQERVSGTGVVLSELLQGAKSNREQSAIMEIFDFIDYVEMTRITWIEVGKLSARLRAAGKTIPLSDISVACCALKANYLIYTIDSHFLEIPGIHLFKTID